MKNASFFRAFAANQCFLVAAFMAFFALAAAGQKTIPKSSSAPSGLRPVVPNMMPSAVTLRDFKTWKETNQGYPIFHFSFALLNSSINDVDLTGAFIFIEIENKTNGSRCGQNGYAFLTDDYSQTLLRKGVAEPFSNFRTSDCGGNNRTLHLKIYSDENKSKLLYEFAQPIAGN